MEQAVNSLVETLLKSPLILIFVILGVIAIIVEVVNIVLAMRKRESKNSDNTEVAKICPRCGGNLIIREGKYGKFLGCSNFPNCKYTEKVH